MNSQVDKQLGYLERADEEHTKDISSLYDLLEKHMDQEIATVKAINQKLALIGVLVIVGLGRDLPWPEILKLLI